MTAPFDANGRLPTNLGNVTVTFDGVAAPINFASFNALQVQVPNEVAAGTRPHPGDRRWCDERGGHGGLGGGRAGTLHGGRRRGRATPGAERRLLAQRFRARPTAARGSYVIVYANGLGATNLPVATGQRTPVTPGSAATLPITASIGGSRRRCSLRAGAGLRRPLNSPNIAVLIEREHGRPSAANDHDQRRPEPGQRSPAAR